MGVPFDTVAGIPFRKKEIEVGIDEILNEDIIGLSEHLRSKEIPVNTDNLLELYNQASNPKKKKTGNYGNRPDNTVKGLGYFGELPMTDGSNKTATEISVGVNIGGKETLIPTLVPTLTQKEKDFLLEGNDPTKKIVDKAAAYAKKRIKAGKSPFAQKGEQI